MKPWRFSLEANCVLCIVGRRGDSWGNACAESFFATLKTELIHRQPWSIRGAARLAIHTYIGVFYNRKRRHSFLGHQSPVGFLGAFHEKEAMAAYGTCPDNRDKTKTTGVRNILYLD